ncbi:conserved Plasmodium protein, unknown function [Plasmodium chabaudi adami]|uniref:Uncharacterized protein n=1 Tax=Plasmodium chabaudi adami TaxID=5826 RepID=A0A1C6YJ47_PLACE|nr:conserved Plasmodium protein, unknown function [Plasmodium chabaudi adami]
MNIIKNVYLLRKGRPNCGLGMRWALNHLRKYTKEGTSEFLKCSEKKTVNLVTNKVRNKNVFEDYKKMEIGKVLILILNNLKNRTIEKETGGNKNKMNNKIENIIEHIFKNDLVINNLNFIQFNMLLTIIHKSEIKIKNDILSYIVVLLNKKILSFSNDINNTNSAWINIINLLSGISKNNKNLIHLIHKKIGNDLNNNEKEIETKNCEERHIFDSSLSEKFIYRIIKNGYDYSIREISLLLHSCYYLNIKNDEIFNFIFDKLTKNDYYFNSLDLHIFVYSVYKLNLLSYVNFLEKIKKDILKNIDSFSNSQIINILLAYTHFFHYYHLKDKKNVLEIDEFISSIFDKCMKRISLFMNKEFCNFLNFILQNDIYLDNKKRNEFFKIISSLLEKNKCYENKLILNTMTDIDIFTIVNFIYKYLYNDNGMFQLKDVAFYNLDKYIIELIMKKKIKENLLAYIIHYSKCRVMSPISMNHLAIFLKHINVNLLEFKMKVILLTSIDRLIEMNKNTGNDNNSTEMTEEAYILKYYLELLTEIHKDLSDNVFICNHSNNSEQIHNNKYETAIPIKHIYTQNNKELFSIIDIKEIIKIIKKGKDNNENVDKKNDNIISMSPIENEIEKIKDTLFNNLNEYIIKNEIIELFPQLLTNKTVDINILSKIEYIVNKVTIDIKNNLLEKDNVDFYTTRNNINRREKIGLSFLQTLNLCNEGIFIKNNSITQFVNNKNIILKYTEHIDKDKGKNIKDYFNFYVHMLLFDINNNLLFFVDNLLRKIWDVLINKHFNYEQNILNVIDIYSSIIKIDKSYYDVYMNHIYKLIFPKILDYYKSLGFKYLSLLFYSNLIHMFLHINPHYNYSIHANLSIELLLKLFDYFLNSVDAKVYDLFKLNIKELSECHERDQQKVQNSLFCPSLNELIYIYRTFYFFHFVELYKYMGIYQLKRFYAFYKVLNYYTFKIKRFSIHEFTQTNKDTSNTHNSIVNSINSLLNRNQKINVTCEYVVFPLFIIDILIYKN